MRLTRSHFIKLCLCTCFTSCSKPKDSLTAVIPRGDGVFSTMEASAFSLGNDVAGRHAGMTRFGFSDKGRTDWLQELQYRCWDIGVSPAPFMDSTITDVIDVISKPELSRLGQLIATVDTPRVAAFYELGFSTVTAVALVGAPSDTAPRLQLALKKVHSSGAAAGVPAAITDPFIETFAAKEVDRAAVGTAAITMTQAIYSHFGSIEE